MKERRLLFYRLISHLLPEMSFNRLKASLLRWCGATVGRRCCICSSAFFSGSGDLTIGDETFIGSKVVVRASPDSSVSIGSRCDIAVNTCIWTGTHNITPPPSEICKYEKPFRIASSGISKSIVIKDGSWICAGVIINAGKTVGRCCVVAAGAVVTHDVPDFSLVAGIPASVIRDLKQ